MAHLQDYITAVSISFILFLGHGIVWDFNESPEDKKDNLTKFAIDRLKDSIKFPVKHESLVGNDAITFGEGITTLVTRANGQTELMVHTGDGNILKKVISIPNGATWDVPPSS